MRTLLIVSSLRVSSLRVGGTERMVAELARALTGLSQDAAVLSLLAWEDSAIGQELHDEGIPVH